MSRDFHKPTLFTSGQFDAYEAAQDAAAARRLAHQSAGALLSRVRASEDPQVLQRVMHYTSTNGLEEFAELWSTAGAHTLPGALWRIYLLRAMIESDPEDASFLYGRGSVLTRGIEPVVAGAPDPAGPVEIMTLSDEILRGVFVGDFAVALLRAASFSRILSVGCTSVADDQEALSPERATALTTKAARLADYARDLEICAKLWPDESLD